ncbi:hypothetical protein Tco_1556541 [Tanacetum coccineum]
MDNSKCGYIPMQERLDLNKTQGASTPEEVKRMQNVPYASAVGKPHWTSVKTILNYLRNIKDMILVYDGNLEAELRRHSRLDSKSAILDPKSDKWVDAMSAEMQSMKDNQVWCLVDLPPNSMSVT